MSTYEEGLRDKGTWDQHKQIAKYYEQRNLLANAAKHYSLCEEQIFAWTSMPNDLLLVRAA
eukprot:5300986-Amphidinium_carterae.2